MSPKNPKDDEVSHPKHYTHGKYEFWDVVVDWNLPFLPGTAMKYICRHLHKGRPKQDIQKAIAFLNRYLQELED